MLKIVFDFLFYTLAIYGALSLIISFVGLAGQKEVDGKHKVRMILMVKNAEEVIEGIVRNVFLGGILRKLMCNGRLTVMDMGSSDRTADILNKLKHEYGYIDILDESEKEKVFNVFSQK